MSSLPISTVDRHAYLFGYPIAHSMSPVLHQTVNDSLNLKWSQFLLESVDVADFLDRIRHPDCYGSAVTMPHKIAVMNHLDDLTEEGRDVGACNTIFFGERDGRKTFIGTNTDVIGIRDSFLMNVSSPDKCFHDRPGMVIGGGGAARSAVYALRKWMRPSEIYIINRDQNEVDAVIEECSEKGYGEGLIHVKTVEEANALEGPGAIISCVPNYPPTTENEKTARKIIECMLNRPHKGAILEMCYHPSPWTEIGALAERAGWQLILGTEAMIYQGLEQARLWTGKPVDESTLLKIKDAIATKLQEARL